jgi:Predicted xylanase/chitin deacetylase
MRKLFVTFAALWLTVAFTSCNHATSKQEKTNDSTQVAKQSPDDAGKPTPNSAAQIMARPEVPVLCYHRITEGRKGDYTVSPATFAAHIKILADSGYHAISPAQLYDYLVYNKSLPAKPVMITFDDSREEHSAIAAPTLEKYGFRGVFFIMTITYDKKNYMTKEQIAQLAKSGHTVGLHTWDHTMVTKFKTEEDWQKEIAQPKEKLEKITGKPVEYIAYPNGVYNHESAEKMSKYMKLSFSLSTKRDTLLPLQSIRRIIVPDMSATSLLKSMRRNFK